MVLDTSALLAMLFAEPEAAAFARVVARAEFRRISAANLLEAGIVADHQADARAGRQLDALVDRIRPSIEPVTAEHAQIARQAYLDFGKGNHPAKLNFGYCFAYALAKATGEPLLFKGDDFQHTDIQPVLAPER